MLSTLYMVDLKTIPVNMPKVQNAQSQTNVNYLVTMKADGTLYLENKLIDEDTLLQGAKTCSISVTIRSILCTKYA